MQFHKTIGFLLLFASFLIILGMSLGNSILWTIVDITVLLICLSSGIWILVLQKSHNHQVKSED